LIDPPLFSQSRSYRASAASEAHRFPVSGKFLATNYWRVWLGIKFTGGKSLRKRFSSYAKAAQWVEEMQQRMFVLTLHQKALQLSQIVDVESCIAATSHPSRP
jgi:hypothetical protein